MFMAMLTCHEYDHLIHPPLSAQLDGGGQAIAEVGAPTWVSNRQQKGSKKQQPHSVPFSKEAYV
jgi:hypothetical protein